MRDVSSSSAPAPDRARRLASGFGLLVALTFGLIVLGALVRAHDAGLACPDWPLCFGDVVPQMNLQVGFEWTHRVVAGSVALLFAALAAMAWRSAARVRAGIAIAAGLLAIQIVLGGLTVLLKLASWTVTAHLITGNGFALTCLLIGVSLRAPGAALPPVSGAARAWISASAALLLVQFALGGLVSSRYAGMVCPEWPACNGGVYFPTFRGNVGLHVLHRMNGYGLVVAYAVAAWTSRSQQRLRTPTMLALGLGLSQVGVGIANVLLGIPVELTGLHSAIAAALALTTAYAMRAAWTRGAEPLRRVATSG